MRQLKRSAPTRDAGPKMGELLYLNNAGRPQDNTQKQVQRNETGGDLHTLNWCLSHARACGARYEGGQSRERRCTPVSMAQRGATPASIRFLLASAAISATADFNFFNRITARDTSISRSENVESVYQHGSRDQRRAERSTSSRNSSGGLRRCRGSRSMRARRTAGRASIARVPRGNSSNSSRCSAP